MGSSASNLKEGVPANPRLLYSNNLSLDIKKPVVMDSSVLIDVDHGSIRYRYGSYSGEPVDKRKRVERPFGGTETVDKQHYFYHARLNKDNHKIGQDEEFKKLYVTKGPAKSKQKFIYYVYGKGFDAQDGIRVHPTLDKLEEKDFSWSVNRKHHDVYYKMTFIQQDKEIVNNVTSEEELLISELESTPDKSSIILQVNECDNISRIKSTLAVKLLKAAGNIHIFNNQRELRNEDVIGDLRKSSEEMFKTFQVKLLRI